MPYPPPCNAKVQISWDSPVFIDVLGRTPGGLLKESGDKVGKQGRTIVKLKRLTAQQFNSITTGIHSVNKKTGV